jgi:hypothetical protein
MTTVSIVLLLPDRASAGTSAPGSDLQGAYPDLELIVESGAAGDAMWRGLGRTKGDVIGICPAGESLTAGAIEQAVRDLANAPESGAITGDVLLVDASGRTADTEAGSVFDLQACLSGATLPHVSASFFRRRMLDDVGVLTERWLSGDLAAAEFELWCRLGVAHPIAYVPHAFARRIRGPEETSGTRSNTRRAHLAHTLASMYRDRGQVDEALTISAGAAPLGDEIIDAMYAQLSLASPSVTDADLQTRQAVWAGKYARPGDSAPFARVASEGRLTVGYNGTLWGIQTGQAILNPVMAAHDRTRVRVIGYSHLKQPAAVTDLFDEFHVTGSLSHQEFCELARSHQLDVLVETNGLSSGTRLPAMASRCAPVQVSYVNHAGTSGVPNVDYLLTDRDTLGSIDQRYYTEQLYALDRCFLTYTYHAMWAPPVAPPPILRNGFVTFGNFGGPYKLNLECLRLWASVLHRVPGSMLLLQNPGMTPANIEFMRRRFGSLGIDADRLTILPGTDRNAVLKNYDLMDISLDSWPYCGGNTIAEALWQGVPVVTLKGNRFVSAYGASLNAAAGIGDLVGHGRAEFAEIAATLAQNVDRLVSLRNSLRDGMTTYGLSDPKAMASALEDAYVEMVRRTRPSTGRDRTRTSGD